VRVHRPEAEAMAAEIRIAFGIVAEAELNKLLFLVRREGREVVDFLVLRRVDARDGRISIVIAAVEFAIAELLPRLATVIEMLLHPRFTLVAEVCLHRHEVDPFICLVDSIRDVIFVKLQENLREVLSIFRHGIAIVIDCDFNFRIREARTKIIRWNDCAIRDSTERVDAAAIVRIEVFNHVRQQLVQEWFATTDMEQHDAVDTGKECVDVPLDLFPRTDIEFLCIGIEVQAGRAAKIAGCTGKERNTREVNEPILVDMIDGKKFLDDEEINVLLPTCLLKLSDDAATLHLRDGQDDASIRCFFYLRKADARQSKDILPLLLFVIINESNEFNLALHDVRELAAIITSAKEIKSLLLADVLIDMIEFMSRMFPFHIVPLIPDAGFPHIPECVWDGPYLSRNKYAPRAA